MSRFSSFVARPLMVGLAGSGLTAALVAGALAAPAGAATPTGRAAIRFHPTRAHSVAAPATTRPGIAHFRSSGSALVLVAEAKHPGVTKTDLVQAVNAGPATKFVRDFRLVAELVGKETSYARITPGTVYFVNLSDQKVKRSNIATMTVSGSRVDAKVPPSHKIVLTKDKRLKTPGSLARSTYLHLINNSYLYSDFLLVGVANGTTYKALRDLVAHPTLNKVFNLIGHDGFTFEAASPKSGSWVPFHGKPGRYVFAALAFPNSQGSPDLHHGQVRVVKVK